MPITLLFGMLIIFFALQILKNLYMTEKRKFTFKDKCILMAGGFIVMFSLGLFWNSTFLILLSLPFLMHSLILVLPLYISIWKKALGR
jgi:hypothetical protein